VPGAVHGRNAVPGPWAGGLLNCGPAAGQPNVRRPRPECFWPVDALELAERLLQLGGGAMNLSQDVRCR
jgi:hypothetical protein